MKKVTLEEAYRNGIVKIGDYFDYKPTFGKCELSPEHTGWKEPQFFESEDLGWRLDEIDGKFILVAAMPTRTKLWLEGKVGYERGIESQNSIAKTCYANWKIAKDVMSLSEELYEKLHRCNILYLYDITYYWLSSSWVYTDAGRTNFCMCVVYAGIECCCVHLYNSLDYSSSHSRGIRPVVFLKSNLKLVKLEEGNGSQEKPWTFS